MSGVEIAGFVLAAIPLMISALENYRETAEVLEGWWKVKKEWRKCKNDLNYHKIALEENLEELLLPLIADEEKLKRLLEAPGGSEWKDPALENLLKRRLPKTYSSYLDTIQEIKEVVRGLDDALGTSKVRFQSRVLETSARDAETVLSENYEHMDKRRNRSAVDRRDGGMLHHIDKTSTDRTTEASKNHVAILSMANVEYQSQRIKLAFNKTVRQELFEEFAMYNARLRDILGPSDRLASLRRVHVSSKDAFLNKFWSHANSVYYLLTEAWSCRCQKFHHANLLLQHRVSSTVDFRLIFWYQTQLEGSPIPWTWQNARVKLLKESNQPVALAVPTRMGAPAQAATPATPDTTPPSMPLIISPPSSSMKSDDGQSAVQVIKAKEQRRSSHKAFFAKFRHEQIQVSHSQRDQPRPDSPPITKPSSSGIPSTTLKVSFAEPVAVPTIAHSNFKLTDLCGTIAACPPDLLPAYGCLTKDDNKYQVQPLSKSDNLPQKHITLDALLSKSSPISLTRQQRYHISLILASSFIQLTPTPWLASKWSKKDILFLHDPMDPNEILTDQPHISRTLAKSNGLQNNTNPSSNTDIFQDSLRNLGIVLLELCFNLAIEDHKLRRNFSSTDEQTLKLINYGIASQSWERDVAGEAGLDYADAVKWCLHNVPESGGSERWREDMFYGVVEKLKYCDTQLSGI